MCGLNISTSVLFYRLVFLGIGSGGFIPLWRAIYIPVIIPLWIAIYIPIISVEWDVQSTEFRNRKIFNKCTVHRENCSAYGTISVSRPQCRMIGMLRGCSYAKKPTTPVINYQQNLYTLRVVFLFHTILQSIITTTSGISSICRPDNINCTSSVSLPNTCLHLLFKSSVCTLIFQWR